MKAYLKEYQKRPKAKATRAAHDKIYRKTEKRQTYLKEWRQTKVAKEIKQRHRKSALCLETRAKWEKSYRLKIRLMVLEHYGRACACCQEARIEFLTIDHMANNGHRHRKEEPGARSIYKWLVRNKFPLGFRTLCFNCNQARAIYGQCPHSQEA